MLSPKALILAPSGIIIGPRTPVVVLLLVEEDVLDVELLLVLDDVLLDVEEDVLDEVEEDVLLLVEDDVVVLAGLTVVVVPVQGHPTMLLH